MKIVGQNYFKSLMTNNNRISIVYGNGVSIPVRMLFKSNGFYINYFCKLKIAKVYFTKDVAFSNCISEFKI